MNLQESIDDLRAKFGSFVAGGETKLVEANDRIAELTKEVDSAKSANVAADAKIGALQADLTAAQSEAKAATDELSKLRGEAKTAGELAAEHARKITASQGIPLAEVPQGAITGESTEQKMEALQKELGAETDPKKRYELAARMNALFFGKKEDPK